MKKIVLVTIMVRYTYMSLDQHVNSQMNNLGNLSIHKTSSYFMEFFNHENKNLKTNRPAWSDMYRVSSIVVAWKRLLQGPDYSLMNIYTYRLVVWGVDYLKCMWVHKLSYDDTMQFYLHDIRRFWDAYTRVLGCPFSHTGMYKTAPTETILRYN